MAPALMDRDRPDYPRGYNTQLGRRQTQHSANMPPTDSTQDSPTAYSPMYPDPNTSYASPTAEYANNALAYPPLQPHSNADYAYAVARRELRTPELPRVSHPTFASTSSRTTEPRRIYAPAMGATVTLRHAECNTPVLPPISTALPSMSGPPPFVLLPPSHSRLSAQDASTAAPAADLSSISCGPLDIIEDDATFVMSVELQKALEAVKASDCGALWNKVINEAKTHAEKRKELVRNALKKRQNDSGVALSPIDKSKLRSRREAKVHRVKERAFEQALKDAIKWLIDKYASKNLTNT